MIPTKIILQHHLAVEFNHIKYHGIHWSVFTTFNTRVFFDVCVEIVPLRNAKHRNRYSTAGTDNCLKLEVRTTNCHFYNDSIVTMVQQILLLQYIQIIRILYISF